MPIIEFNIKFDQEKLCQYITKKSYSNVVKKLTQVNNISSAYDGICRGLSNSYLLHENSNQGDAFINGINDSLMNIKKTKGKLNTIERNKHKSLKVFSKALLNETIADSLNNQINYDRAFNLAKLSHFPSSLEFSENDKNSNNLNFIETILNKNKTQINKKFNYLSHENEIIELIKIYYNIAKLAESNLMKNTYPDLRLSTELKNKIINEQILTTDETKEFLKNAFIFNSQLTMQKMTGKKLNAGTINNKNFPINHSENIFNFPYEINLKKLKENIENKLTISNSYLSLVATKTHCMAISVSFDTTTKNYIYKFFDPNYGIKKYKDKDDFFNSLEELLEYSTNKNSKNRNEFNELIIECTPMEKTNNNNKLKSPEIDQQVFHNYLKNSLINKKIKLSKTHSIILKNHDSDKNKTSVNIFNKNKSTNIEIQENNTEKLIKLISDNLSKINFDINKTWEFDEKNLSFREKISPINI